jgi:LPS-assembly lipoprotein
MKTHNIHHFPFYLLLVISLASCGFQLKQSASLPTSFGPVSVDGISKFSSFYKSLRNALRQSSINIVDQAAASHSIKLNPSREKKVLSVDAGGKVSEYELILRLTYQVSSDGDTVKTHSRTISTSTFYSVSNTEVLGDSKVEEDIFKRLEERLVDQMIKQISTSY